jgi:carboxyl-terminal processing protease
MRNLFFFFFLSLFPFSQVLAGWVTINIITPEEKAKLESPITRAEAFWFFADLFQDFVPKSSQYIELQYKDVLKGTDLYQDLQKLVYLDFINNSETFLAPQKNIDLHTFHTLSKKILEIEAKSPLDTLTLKKTPTTLRDMQKVGALLENKRAELGYEGDISGVEGQIQIFQDVYETLLKKHYDRDTLSQKDIIYKAIEGAAKGTGDQYTTYFPPTENKNFQENLTWEYEGIGAYVEMPEPWKLIIISPMVGSPSEKAGLKWGDIITQVGDKKLTAENSLQEVISWIKGPKGTKVSLTVLRNNIEIIIEVERATIIVKDVDSKKLDSNTYYIQIKNFGPHVSTEFETALDGLLAETKTKKVIFDLRNNPGGYLDQVSDMLSHFVPKDEATAIVSYGKTDESYPSLGYTKVDWSKYKLVFLQNSGSASASEIMIGTIKDYFPQVELVGEKTYGKWSVQSIKEYFDGSSLKFTIAKWFTGKTRKWIDKVGILPDIEVVLDQKRFENGYDNQLEVAKKR